MYRPPFVNGSNIADLKGGADVIIEQDPLTTFLGFTEPNNQDESAEKWAVCKIVQDGTVYPIKTRVLWASGSFQYLHKFSDYLTLDYQYRNF